MPVHPQVQAVLDQAAALGAPPMNTLPPAVIRANREAAPQVPGPEVARVEDRLVPGPGGDIPVRLYTPEGRGPFPILLYFHGGGWVLGSIQMSDPTCRHLANAAGCMVASVEYRLAPEARFPAAPEDCYAATVWVAKNAATIGADPRRVAVGGVSAGGNLAAAVALMARDKGGPPLAHQLLINPVIERDFSTDSYRHNAEGYMISKDSMVWFWDLYLRDDGDAEDPYAAPIKAKDLRGLPPALVITAEFDPLRDEGEAYARRLAQADVPTTCTRYDGMIHGFYSMPHAVDKAREAIAESAAALKTAFALAL